MKYVYVPLHTNADCRVKFTKWPNADKLKDNQICVGVLENGPFEGSCNGDSGGALVVPKNGYAILYGIVSYGGVKYCADPDHPTIFTRVTSFIEWIEENL